MKKEKIPTIKVQARDIEKCSIEGCTEIATAFLQESKELAGKRIIKKQTGFCTAHALAKHQEIINGGFIETGQTPIYQPESFEKPHKLQ